LDAGPEIDMSDSIIIVEGRADVLNLLRYGYRNAISLGGAAEKVPKTIIELSKTKETTVFLDGDRGGDLILKRLLEVAEIDFVARAPQGKEVEELTGKEIMKALMSKVPVSEVVGHIQTLHEQIPKQRFPVPEKIFNYVKNLNGTLEAVILDKDLNEIKRIPVKEMAEVLQDIKDKMPFAVVFDGVISQRILDIAMEKSIQYVIGNRLGNIVRKPSGVVVLTFDEIVS
jgi:DNA primase (bacterial type)